ncbi:dihydrodipicolinate synthase/N-acetylneuraminate lyase [Cytobacillus oceanisediminis]|uniref:Dihydrodipicolinate synthase/N-acetylneuraminate lyase n=1 Tax=Cytobacillus oceanisediminis TaxID=665099 RepID=A0A2V2ZW12_9BACI|nr:dihydrodipicolinate synthase family protein [Cytobacillus oceanisediminis]PWW28235.1 dihydrodipicolinate synthase/N-acetylneuraminate lyase [Cytobacillus oceanisediminis]
MENRLKAIIHKAILEGLVIPAHPLALNAMRELDEERQRGLTRYYMAAGAGGVAVGVHTTQFEIRDPKYNLNKKVLELAIDEVRKAKLARPFVTIAGICGDTFQALEEARFAKELGYDMGLVSMGGLSDWSETDLIDRLEAISQIIPVFGFYLQPSVGGRILSYKFWKTAAEIPGVMAIKIAPFNRYQTLDVVRAVAHSSRSDEIALYTGNDDNIIVDLLTAYNIQVDGKTVKKRIVGGLLGHWAVWTKKAVDLLEEIKQVLGEENSTRISELLSLNVEVTDVNAALFDPANGFSGCIPGIHEILRRQGLLEGRWCLNPDEDLSPGQLREIERVYREYPHLNDDDFVLQNRSKWLSNNNVY